MNRVARTLASPPEPRSGLLVLALGASAGVHAALVPEHLEEMPVIGFGFIPAAALATVVGVVLVYRPASVRAALAAAVLLLGMILAYVAATTLSIPYVDGTPEPVEPIAVVDKVVEALGLLLALSLCARPRRSDRADEFIVSVPGGRRHDAIAFRDLQAARRKPARPARGRST